MSHRPAAPIDQKALREKLMGLLESGQSDALLDAVVGLVSELQKDNQRLGDRVRELLRKLYGRKSEKVSAEQLSLFFAALDDQAPESAKAAIDKANVPQPEAPPKRVSSHKGRTALPVDLPREEVVVALSETERLCPECGEVRKTIGHVDSEVLEFRPAHFVILVEKREKVACEKCEGNVDVADSDKVMDRGRPGPGLLANILVEKHDDSMPLERQSKQYARSGVRIPPSTIGDWYRFGAGVISPVATLISICTLESFAINADDTGHRVQDPTHKNRIKRGRLWCFVGDRQFVTFHYAPDWKAEHPGEFLRDFDGFVQCDDYAGYSSEVGPPDERHIVVADDRRLGCGMHIRRKFEIALDAGNPDAAIAIAFFRRLYDLERTFKAQGLDKAPVARLEQRNLHSQPILSEFKAWLDQKRDTTIPDTLLYKAVRYAVNQWDYFARCFTDGRFEIDNGAVEREFRRIRLGEKNFLFAGSDAAATRIADVCTVIATCKANGVEPLAYLTDVIAKLQRGWPLSDIEALLPHRWLAARAA